MPVAVRPLAAVRSVAATLAAAITLAAITLAAATPARGQSVTVQLPTFQVTGVSTTVLVPDRGAAYLGGVNSARFGSNSFGSPLLPFANRASGRDLNTGGFHVTAWIHDLRAMDEALLAQAAARQGPGAGGTGPLAAARDATGDAPQQSVAEIRRRRAAAAATQADDARSYFDKAEARAASGKTGIARVYYRMALSRAEGELRERIAARLQQLDQTTLADRR